MKISEMNFSIKNIVIAFLVVFALILVYKVSNILVLLFVSVLISYIINPLVRQFERIKIPRIIALIIMVAIFGVLLFLGIAIVLPIIIEDIIHISRNVPQYAQYLFGLTERLLTRFGVEVSLTNVQTFVIERMGVISSYVFNTLTTAAASVTGIVSVLLNIFIVPVMVFFLLKDFSDVRGLFSKVITRLKWEKLVVHLSDFERFVGRYYRGMFLVALILSCLYSSVLILVGVEAGLFLGIMTGLGAMVPYVGFAFGFTVSTIVTVVQFQDVIHPIYTVAGFLLVQFLESMVITPKIVGDSLGLSPVLVIVGLMIGGTLFGFVGILIALPITAFTKSLVDKYFFKMVEEESLNENSQ